MYSVEVVGYWKKDAGDTLSAGDVYEPDKVEVTSSPIEVVAAEIKMPDTQELEYLTFELDGQELTKYIVIPGKKEENFMPVKQLLKDDRQWFVFGQPMVVNPLTNTTLKVAESIRPIARAGSADVTEEFWVRLWGVKYKDEKELKRVYGDNYVVTTETGSTNIIEVETGDTYQITTKLHTEGIADLSLDNWNQLPGGAAQNNPKFMPFMRFARNANSITTTDPYPMRYDTAKNVSESRYEMYFKRDTKRMYIFEKMGVRAIGTDLEQVFFRIGDGVIRPIDPIELNCSTSDYYNPYHFGHAYPFVPADQNLYLGLPNLPNSVVVYDKATTVMVKSGGSTIDANAITVVLAGKVIDELSKGNVTVPGGE